MSKQTKLALMYAAAGVATLLWQTERASKGEGIWPGFGTNPPGALVGAVETIAFWPWAVFKTLTDYSQAGAGAHQQGASAIDPSNLDTATP